MTKIEIIAIGEDKLYSVGEIQVNKKGEVYLFEKNKLSEHHTSRHASGEVHAYTSNFRDKIRKGEPLSYFKGFEPLGVVWSFSMQSLPLLYYEYNIKQNDAVFAVDMRQYTFFNLTFVIFTDEGIGDLYKNFSKFEKSQIYLYTDCHPKIAICAFDAGGSYPK
jgi:hypothetical protein